MNDRCGSQAATFTYDFLADGFRAEGYTTDTYGRVVAEVFDPSGVSLNVALAASGLGGDRYLARFRHENPDLAARLDDAFATAPTPSCVGATSPTSPPTTSPPSNSGCHPAYTTCVPIKGDGSGNGDANDLDCGDIGYQVHLAGKADPYRLDRDGDGLGCESYG